MKEPTPSFIAESAPCASFARDSGWNKAQRLGRIAAMFKSGDIFIPHIEDAEQSAGRMRGYAGAYAHWVAFNMPYLSPLERLWQAITGKRVPFSAQRMSLMLQGIPSKKPQWIDPRRVPYLDNYMKMLRDENISKIVANKGPR